MVEVVFNCFSFIYHYKFGDRKNQRKEGLNLGDNTWNGKGFGCDCLDLAVVIPIRSTISHSY